jgi:pimeloyl-ACP methyl ester carboxylesterase
MPVLAIGGDRGMGEVMLTSMSGAATDTNGTIIKNCGHYVPEECPDELVYAMLPFLLDK